MIELAVPNSILHTRDGFFCFAHEKYILSALFFQRLYCLARAVVFFVSRDCVAVGINSRPFINTSVSVSFKLF